MNRHMRTRVVPKAERKGVGGKRL